MHRFVRSVATSVLVGPLLLSGKDGTEEPVLLVDQFRAARDPIKPSLLRGRAKFQMRLTRQEHCGSSTAETYAMLHPLKTYDAGARRLERAWTGDPAMLRGES